MYVLLRRLLAYRMAPALIAYRLLPGMREKVDADVAVWQFKLGRTETGAVGLMMLLGDREHSFRNLYYNRTKQEGSLGRLLFYVLRAVWKDEHTLHINMADIGPGLFLQHGYNTGIGAAKIGANCWINQHVIIGADSELRRPVLGDRVRVSVGAIVLGGITLGDDSTVAAGAVVTKDVPAGVTVAGIPAKPLNRTRGANEAIDQSVLEQIARRAAQDRE